MAETNLNLRGLKCPLPALKTRKALTRLAAGDELVVECTDPLAGIDIPNLLRETGDDAFQQPNPMPAPMSDRFPTLGSLHTFYSGGHLMMHLGQISAWRRMIGLSPA